MVPEPVGPQLESSCLSKHQISHITHLCF